MRGAFVVRLRESAHGNRFEGSVEEVDSGKEARFVSANELIEFLRERIAQIAVEPPKEGRNG
jgi:hypothetical protein